MDSARKHLKGHQDFHVFEDIPKDLYELWKQQMEKFKEARERGHKAYFSKANPDKLNCFIHTIYNATLTLPTLHTLIKILTYIMLHYGA